MTELELLRTKYAYLIKLIQDIEAAAYPPEAKWCDEQWSELYDRISAVLGEELVYRRGNERTSDDEMRLRVVERQDQYQWRQA